MKKFQIEDWEKQLTIDYLEHQILMENIVEVKNLKKNYGLKEAVKGISFNIKKDEILGLLGPNGSGKTTTIGMMLGLLKPSNGEILIEGKKIEENRIEILKK